jgi:hypothetical protein
MGSAVTIWLHANIGDGCGSGPWGRQLNRAIHRFVHTALVEWIGDVSSRRGR